MMFLLYVHDELLFQSSSRIDELIATRFYYLIRKFHREGYYARQDPFKHMHPSRSENVIPGPSKSAFIKFFNDVYNLIIMELMY